VSNETIDFKLFFDPSDVSFSVLDMRWGNQQMLSNLSKKMTTKTGHGYQLIS
jgi:hypothetical protein